MTIPVIDIFAGPGGLGEGFCKLRDSKDRPVFKIALSIEKDPIAHQTLLLRSFFRQFPDGKKPDGYYQQLKSGKVDWQELAKQYPARAKHAAREVWQAELGKEAFPPAKVDRRIASALNGARKWVLIGGPPCQVYSQVGRSRIKGESAWHFARDKRHLLYKEYLRIIAAHEPPVFVMENVKGLLSSKRAGKKIIQQIVADLREPRKAEGDHTRKKKPLSYELYALVEPRGSAKDGSKKTEPSKYIIRSEDHGIPQARHRLILVGVKNDLGVQPGTLAAQPKVNMWKAIQDLPSLRSRLSQTDDSGEHWAEAIKKVLNYRTLTRPRHRKVGQRMERIAPNLNHKCTGAEYVETKTKPVWQTAWFYDRQLGGVCNHATRSHIPKDLWRYFYAACYAQVKKKSPLLDDFPAFLLPQHENALNAKARDGESMFADRFRVQVKGRPSTTITSHISKDGHYFIHPDPKQCRSLTVREAARLQTFPDNYFFMGPRTAQYQQVGNAVPPLLARQIAKVISKVFS